MTDGIYSAAAFFSAERRGRTVSVLGTPYSVEVKKYDDDPLFYDDGFAGYCDCHTKRIVLCDLKSHKDFKSDPEEKLLIIMKATLRHEIVHAFLDESGLQDNAVTYDIAWAKNEEMVDWIALQGPKIYQAWKEADAL